MLRLFNFFSLAGCACVRALLFATSSLLNRPLEVSSTGAGQLFLGEVSYFSALTFRSFGKVPQHDLRRDLRFAALVHVVLPS